jgi:NAD(P)-dependent dehydrogenase (short-subunit alcohol dehydrogenase family)
MTHPVFAPGHVAVITGAASGIGLATAKHCAGLGLRLCLADHNEPALSEAAAALAAGGAEVEAVPTDVGDAASVERLRQHAWARFGGVDLLMNNAGQEGGGALLGDPARWAAILRTNLWGVINGVQIFAPAMIEHARARGGQGAIVNTGSKQGITCPPGDTAYNVSKAGIKVVTEALAHDLREAGARVSAHLLIPGFTFTGFTRVRTATKPDAAWTAEQVVDFLVAGMARGDFYILCPDNAVDRATDEKRILWAAQDIIQNRPALSRWHPAFKAAFEAFMAG